MLDRSIIDQLRRRRVPLIGEVNGWWSFLHIDDAAAATATAIERGAAGIYNIVGDEPGPVREWLPALAALVGAKAALACAEIDGPTDYRRAHRAPLSRGRVAISEANGPGRRPDSSRL